MMMPQLVWLRDNQDENVVAWKVIPGLIDAGSLCLRAARQSG
ncbi:hypothetical protein AWB67_06954 [Caballeronia terrestris]|jgi:hypothetical protein|uniref:Uncharacterized protein n=2 Tax=Caballeronia TaxID=1827195 RepID=A0A7Z7N7I1_9BURK|nr:MULTISPECIES: hypothetical protein [Burkholderiaceae]TCK32666.1 hypothetical protein B0G84_8497 [Paraburkholderia sp. BL8N3]TCK33321.1 hypothetical protein B0G84_7528 [Paraburkholderia sp. BL8N3]SAL85478.1 hypothetical protein AWB67_06954 [Caballeronia terrestris]SOE89008.1 hypothetical protein SAMN05446927_7643 [Caballeronia arationis]